MNTHTRLVIRPAPLRVRLAMLAGLAGVTLLAGCMTPATTVRYGQVVSEPGGQVSRTELYSGGTGVFSGSSAEVYAEEPSSYSDGSQVYANEPSVIYREPTVVYQDTGVTVSPPLVVQPPIVVAPPPVYVHSYPYSYPSYSGYPYGPGFYGSYYRGQRLAPPPRHVHRSQYHRGDRAAHGRHERPPSSGIRQSPRPPAYTGGATVRDPRPGIRPPARPPAFTGGPTMGNVPGSRGPAGRSGGIRGDGLEGASGP